MKLAKATLLATFGRNSPHPARATLLRLCCLYITSGMLSYVLGKGLAPLLDYFAQDSSLHLFWTALLATQFMAIFVLLPAMGLIRDGRNTFNRLLLAWPLSHLKSWMVLLLPGLVLTSLGLVLVSVPLSILFLASGISVAFLMAASLLGAIAALGLVYGVAYRYIWFQFGIVPIVLWIEYILFTRTPANYTLLCLVTALLCTGFLYSRTYLLRDAAYVPRSSMVRTVFLPRQWWFLKKMWRSGGIRLSFTTTFLLSAGLLFIFRNDAGVTDVQVTLAALLAAVHVSDVRSLVRQKSPVEIVGLRGTVYFMATQVLAAAICCLLAISPLLWGAGLSFAHVLQLASGIAVGIFAGTVIVPGQRDISGQSMATLLCIAVLTIPAYIPILRSIPTETLGIFITTSLLGAAFAVEYHRNTYDWRSNVS